MPAWKKAGKLTVTCAECLIEQLKAGIPSIIIDLRSAKEAAKGHIPGAVSLPLDELTHAYFKFPSDKKAPIVLYSEDTQSAITGFEIIGLWGGYTNIVVIEDGFAAWKKQNGQIEKGELPTKIVYEPKPRPGEISIEEFKKIAESHPADKLILDVRDEDEAIQGMLIGAKNIPVQEISKRVNELPKDKELIIHCLTGVRAELAYHTVKGAGLNARFLNAIIKIDSTGKYEISKE
ncbi:MAG TPA: rhodanese-like domain-containing protein [Nitrospirota bacterium]|nr:rhodanese-like domain-containing protein [Nitrospirota bacterium]